MNWLDMHMEPQAGERTHMVPILSIEENIHGANEADRPETLALLPLRNAVLFPGTLIPITIGREKSITLIREVYGQQRLLGTVTQLDARTEDPDQDQVYGYGCLSRVLKIIEMPDGNITAILQGIQRFRVGTLTRTEPYMEATVAYLPDIEPQEDDQDFHTLIKGIKDAAIQVMEAGSHVPREAVIALRNMDNTPFLVNFIATSVEVENVQDKLKLLTLDFVSERAARLLEILYKEMEINKIKQDIQQKVKGEIDQQQKEYYLNNQLKTIQDELGITTELQDVEKLRAEGAAKAWPQTVAEHFQRELNKLERSNPHNPDYGVQRDYVQFMLALPWETYSADKLDLKEAQKVLDQDHYGLDQVKERILEYLAVLKIKGDLKSPILCLYGPPGVGKTSLGKSVARALGRTFARISLGGLHDESEIRGHRRTYIGALPGRILESIKRCGTSNPVIVLDEIDKVGSDFRGDPGSALLEVLDPDQNNSFHDNYLDLDYDLSKVLFITTANQIDKIQPALRDRMELISVEGYLAEEKREIAARHLVPKQLGLHGLTEDQLQFPTESLDTLINDYTRESGVRVLDRQIAKLVRHRAKQLAFEEAFEPAMGPQEIGKIIGDKRLPHDVQKGNEFPGVVTGLAWTEAGGEILFIESTTHKGSGKLTTTGNLGEVMKESAVIALQYLRSRPDLLGLKPEAFDKLDFHIHVPEGAIPKDGPSAGVAMLSALASALKQTTIRSGVAMTGEITLRGRVLPVGGIKEKILAAKRSGIRTIVLSQENRQDVERIKPQYIEGLEFHYVHTIADLLAYIF